MASRDRRETLSRESGITVQQKALYQQGVGTRSAKSTTALSSSRSNGVLTISVQQAVRERDDALARVAAQDEEIARLRAALAANGDASLVANSRSKDTTGDRMNTHSALDQSMRFIETFATDTRLIAENTLLKETLAVKERVIATQVDRIAQQQATIQGLSGLLAGAEYDRDTIIARIHKLQTDYDDVKNQYKRRIAQLIKQINTLQTSNNVDRAATQEMSDSSEDLRQEIGSLRRTLKKQRALLTVVEERKEELETQLIQKDRLASEKSDQWRYEVRQCMHQIEESKIVYQAELEAATSRYRNLESELNAMKTASEQETLRHQVIERRHEDDLARFREEVRQAKQMLNATEAGQRLLELETFIERKAVELRALQAQYDAQVKTHLTTIAELTREVAMLRQSDAVWDMDDATDIARGSQINHDAINLRVRVNQLELENEALESERDVLRKHNASIDGKLRCESETTSERNARIEALMVQLAEAEEATAKAIEEKEALEHTFANKAQLLEENDRERAALLARTQAELANFRAKNEILESENSALAETSQQERTAHNEQVRRLRTEFAALRDKLSQAQLAYREEVENHSSHVQELESTANSNIGDLGDKLNRLQSGLEERNRELVQENTLLKGELEELGAQIRQKEQAVIIAETGADDTISALRSELEVLKLAHTESQAKLTALQSIYEELATLLGLNYRSDNHSVTGGDIEEIDATQLAGLKERIITSVKKLVIMEEKIELAFEKISTQLNTLLPEVHVDALAGDELFDAEERTTTSGRGVVRSSSDGVESAKSTDSSTIPPSITETIPQIAQFIQSLEHNKAALEEELTSVKDTLDQVSALQRHEAQTNKTTQDELLERMQLLQERVGLLEATNNEHLESIATLQKEKEENTNTIKALESVIAANAKESAQIDSQLRAAQRKIANVTAENNAKDEHVHALEEQISKKTVQIRDLQENHADAMGRKMQELSAAQLAATEARRECQTLQLTMAAMQSQIALNTSADFSDRADGVPLPLENLLGERLDKLRQNADSARAEAQEARESLARVATELQLVEARVAALQEENSSVNDQLAEVESERADLRIANARLATQVETTQGTMRDLQSSTEERISGLQTKQSTLIQELADRTAAFEAEKQQLVQGLQSTKQKAKALARELEESKSNHQSAQRSATQLSQQLSESRTELAALRRQYAALESDHTALSERHQQATDLLVTKSKKMEALAEDLHNITSEKETLAEAFNQYKRDKEQALKVLTAQKEAAEAALTNSNTEGKRSLQELNDAIVQQEGEFKVKEAAFEEEKTTLTSRIEEVKALLNAEKDAKRQVELERNRLAESQQEVQVTLKAQVKRIVSLEEQLAAKTIENKGLANELQSYKERLASIEVRLDAEKEAKALAESQKNEAEKALREIEETYSAKLLEMTEATNSEANNMVRALVVLKGACQAMLSEGSTAQEDTDDDVNEKHVDSQLARLPEELIALLGDISDLLDTLRVQSAESNQRVEFVQNQFALIEQLVNGATTEIDGVLSDKELAGEELAGATQTLDQVQALVQRVTELTSKYQELQRSNNSLNSDLVSAHRDIRDAADLMMEQGKRLQANLEAEKAAWAEEAQSYKEQIAGAEEAIDEAESALASLRNEKAATEKELHRTYGEQIARLEKDKADLMGYLDELRAKRKAVFNEFKGFGETASVVEVMAGVSSPAKDRRHIPVTSKYAEAVEGRDQDALNDGSAEDLDISIDDVAVAAREKLEDSRRKLEESEISLRTRIAELEVEMQALTESMNQDTAAQLSTLKANSDRTIAQLQSDIATLRAEIDQLTSASQEANETLTETKRALAESTALLEAEQTKNRILQEAHEKAVAEVAEGKKLAQEAVNETSLIASEKQVLERQYQDLQTEHNALKVATAEVVKSGEVLSAEKAAQDKEIKRLRAEVASLEEAQETHASNIAELQAIREEKAEVETRFREVKDQNEALKLELQQVKVALEQKTKEALNASFLTKESNAQMEEIEALTSQNEELTSQKDALAKQIALLEEEGGVLSKDIAEKNILIKRLKDEIVHQKQEFQARWAELLEEQERIKDAAKKEAVAQQKHGIERLLAVVGGGDDGETRPNTPTSESGYDNDGMSQIKAELLRLQKRQQELEDTLFGRTIERDVANVGIEQERLLTKHQTDQMLYMTELVSLNAAKELIVEKRENGQTLTNEENVRLATIETKIHALKTKLDALAGELEELERLDQEHSKLDASLLESRSPNKTPDRRDGKQATISFNVSLSPISTRDATPATSSPLLRVATVNHAEAAAHADDENGVNEDVHAVSHSPAADWHAEHLHINADTQTTATDDVSLASRPPSVTDSALEANNEQLLEQLRRKVAASNGNAQRSNSSYSSSSGRTTPDDAVSSPLAQSDNPTVAVVSVDSPDGVKQKFMASFPPGTTTEQVINDPNGVVGGILDASLNASGISSSSGSSFAENVIAGRRSAVGAQHIP